MLIITNIANLSQWTKQPTLDTRATLWQIYQLLKLLVTIRYGVLDKHGTWYLRGCFSIEPGFNLCGVGLDRCPNCSIIESIIHKEDSIASGYGCRFEHSVDFGDSIYEIDAPSTCSVVPGRVLLNTFNKRRVSKNWCPLFELLFYIKNKTYLDSNSPLQSETAHYYQINPDKPEQKTLWCLSPL